MLAATGHHPTRTPNLGHGYPSSLECLLLAQSGRGAGSALGPKQTIGFWMVKPELNGPTHGWLPRVPAGLGRSANLPSRGLFVAVCHKTGASGNTAHDARASDENPNLSRRPNCQYAIGRRFTQARRRSHKEARPQRSPRGHSRRVPRLDVYGPALSREPVGQLERLQVGIRDHVQSKDTTIGEPEDQSLARSVDDHSRNAARRRALDYDLVACH